MSNLVIELPPKAEQDAFNRVRWAELSRDPELAKIDNRFETDRHGYLIMSPMPSYSHGEFQLQIGFLLKTLLPEGRTRTECPVSTSDGVKGADVSWISRERDQGNAGELVCIACPEICVEVLSPSNTASEMSEKRELYFEAGASEVWFCSQEGVMQFFSDAKGTEQERSTVCPDFPIRVELT